MILRRSFVCMCVRFALYELGDVFRPCPEIPEKSSAHVTEPLWAKSEYENRFGAVAKWFQEYNEPFCIKARTGMSFVYEFDDLKRILVGDIASTKVWEL